MTPATSLRAEPVERFPPEIATTASLRVQAVAVFAALVLLRLALAALLPIVKDETY